MFGFVINTYEPGVINNNINRQQFTVISHVDDLHLFHTDERGATKVIKS